MTTVFTFFIYFILLVWILSQRRRFKRPNAFLFGLVALMAADLHWYFVRIAEMDSFVPLHRVGEYLFWVGTVILIMEFIDLYRGRKQDFEKLNRILGELVIPIILLYPLFFNASYHYRHLGSSTRAAVLGVGLVFSVGFGLKSWKKKPKAVRTTALTASAFLIVADLSALFEIVFGRG